MLNILHVLSHSVFTNNARRSELASSRFQRSKLLKVMQYTDFIRAENTSSLLHVNLNSVLPLFYKNPLGRKTPWR